MRKRILQVIHELAATSVKIIYILCGSWENVQKYDVEYYYYSLNHIANDARNEIESLERRETNGR